MELKLRNLDFLYDQDGIITQVGVRIDSYDADGTNFNGYIKITKEEYDTHSSDIPALATLAMDKIKLKLGA